MAYMTDDSDDENHQTLYFLLHPNMPFQCCPPFQVQSIAEARKYFYRGVVMPLQVNNVDVTVAANAVYGLTASVLTGLLPASVLDPAKDPTIAVGPLLSWRRPAQI